MNNYIKILTEANNMHESSRLIKAMNRIPKSNLKKTSMYFDVQHGDVVVTIEEGPGMSTVYDYKDVASSNKKVKDLADKLGIKTYHVGNTPKGIKLDKNPWG